MAEWPDDLLAGADHPRPLPPGLRRRLEQQLAGAPRPLDPGFAERLSDELTDPVAGTLADVDGPRPLPDGLRQRLERQLVRTHHGRRVLAAAAVVVALAGAGLTAARLARSSSSSSPSKLAASAPKSTAASGQRGLSGQAASAPAPAEAAPGVPGAAVPGAGVPAAGAAVPNGAASPITPGQGPSAGGTMVSINGAGFTGATTVRFGDVKATRFTVLSDRLIRVVTPAHPAGLVNVTVVTPAGARVVGSYTYLP